MIWSHDRFLHNKHENLLALREYILQFEYLVLIWNIAHALNHNVEDEVGYPDLFSVCNRTEVIKLQLFNVVLKPGY